MADLVWSPSWILFNDMSNYLVQNFMEIFVEGIKILIVDQEQNNTSKGDSQFKNPSSL